MKLLLRTVLAVVTGLTLVVGNTAMASAAETDAVDTKSAASVDVAAACPQPGARVKRSDSPRIYLVGPAGELNWIPNETIYYRLWDTMSYTVDNRIMGGGCQNVAYEFYNGHLAKSASSSATYVWDQFGGGYRWITSPAVFNKYGFSWGKIRTVSCICDTGPNWT
jgi:hypothetical protein